MMDQGIFLFDNQYHPDVIDRVYQRILETTWGNCINAQKAMCQSEVIGGPLTDFVCDEERNEKYGFPAGSYSTFIKKKLLTGNQKYILEHFIRGHELLTVRDMLQTQRFTKQYIFHLADYTFMNLKCQVVQNGTWLVIPIGTSDGISQSMMDAMMADYDNPYTPSRWTLEIRPKVSYGYAETTSLSLIQNNKIYLDKFTEQRQYFKAEEINDWKVCVSEISTDLNLLRATPAFLQFDDNARPYLEVSQAFSDHILTATFNVHCFIYNEAHKAGYTISPNYIGPTQYLKSNFDEYVAAVDSARLKVVAMDADGGWTMLGGADKTFGSSDDLIAVGFTPDQCWLAIPTSHGVCPIYPGNFRVWEYDSELDTLGRMVATDMEVKFPNLYLYKMQSDSTLLYIEWFRDDETVGTSYDDFTEDYRNYIGDEFAMKLMAGDLPAVISNFTPMEREFNPNTFIKEILLYSSHEYRVEMMTELLHETGLHYDEIQDNIDAANAEMTTLIYRLSLMPELYQSLKRADRGDICIATLIENLKPFDVYIDGVHVRDAKTNWRDFNQYISIPTANITEDSVIIIDLYDYVPIVCESVEVNRDFLQTTLPEDFPITDISANNLVLTWEDGTRISPYDITYGLYANEVLVQVPESMVDWDSLGITIDDPRIADRVAVTHPEGTFKAVVFRLLLPTSAYRAKLLTDDGETIVTKEGLTLLVKAGDVFVSTEGYDLMDVSNPHKFSKKVHAKDLAFKINGATEGDIIYVRNANIWRHGIANDLSKSNVITITSFTGADDPSRLLCFVNGYLQGNDAVTGEIPYEINGDFEISFTGAFTPNAVGEVVYLPFPTDRYDVMSDENGLINLANSGVMGISVHDMVYEGGLRISTDSLISITNQLVKAPKPSTMYTIIRMHRDSNLFGFQDTSDQSFMDKLLNQSPGYKQYVMSQY